MSPNSKAGSNWSDDEAAKVVTAYFELKKQQDLGLAPIKLHLYKEIGEEISRSHKSVERKFQNISAVLERLGIAWIPGLAPLHHFQQSLADAIESYLVNHPQDEQILAQSGAFSDSHQWPYTGPTTVLELEAVPPIDASGNGPPEYIERLVRKFDPAVRDFRNRALGFAGEKRVFESEKARLLCANREDLAAKVDWISQTHGDGAGFDILSFDNSGREVFIEVKTTNGPKRTPFFMTRNELEFSKERAENYSLVRLFDFKERPRAFEMRSPLKRAANFAPENYKVSF